MDARPEYLESHVLGDNWLVEAKVVALLEGQLHYWCVDVTYIDPLGKHAAHEPDSSRFGFEESLDAARAKALAEHTSVVATIEAQLMG